MVSYRKILIPVIVAALCLSGCAKRPASGSETAVTEKETETVDAMEDVSTRDLYYKSREKISVVDAACLSGMLDLTVKERDRLLDEGISYGYDYCKSADRTVELWENLTPELKALLLRDDYAEYAYKSYVLGELPDGAGKSVMSDIYDEVMLSQSCTYDRLDESMRSKVIDKVLEKAVKRRKEAYSVTGSSPFINNVIWEGESNKWYTSVQNMNYPSDAGDIKDFVSGQLIAMKAMRNFTSEDVSDAVLKEYKEQWYEFVQGPTDIMLYEEVDGDALYDAIKQHNESLDDFYTYEDYPKVLYEHYIQTSIPKKSDLNYSSKGLEFDEALLAQSAVCDYLNEDERTTLVRKVIDNMELRKADPDKYYGQKNAFWEHLKCSEEDNSWYAALKNMNVDGVYKEYTDELLKQH